MKIPLPFNFPDNHINFMRSAGYAPFADPNTGITSYVKRLQGDFYPRFHVYIETNKDNQVVINLHLDQKKPSYAGAHAHSGEYEGGAVDIEGRRITGLIKNKMDNNAQIKSVTPQPPAKGFFAKLFK